MWEVDFLPVGDGENSGDAIALRFTRPDTGGLAHVVVDAGFQDDGEALVTHVKKYYGTTSIGLAILTHPDGDHIGGMGEVVRGLQVAELWLHQIGEHGGATLPASDAVEELIHVASEQGTVVREAWAGAQALGGAITILGPDRNYYEQLVAEQVSGDAPVAVAKRALLEAARGLFDRLTDYLPGEIPFDAKEVTPRNNSSMITLLSVDGRRLLLTSDAGVPALDRAWDTAEAYGLTETPRFVQIPHQARARRSPAGQASRETQPLGCAACRSRSASRAAWMRTSRRPGSETPASSQRLGAEGELFALSRSVTRGPAWSRPRAAVNSCTNGSRSERSVVQRQRDRRSHSRLESGHDAILADVVHRHLASL